MPQEIPAAVAPAQVNTEHLLAAEAEPENWMSHGCNYGETRFSPLADINADSVDKYAYILERANAQLEAQ